MGVRVFSEIEATIMFAVDPIIVPFPPKPAPKANAHHRAEIGTPNNPISFITGIIAIVIGTLSINAESIATNHNMITPKIFGGRKLKIFINVAR